MLIPVFISIGSNVGDSHALVQAAMERLRRESAGGISVSSLWHTEPVDCPPGSPDFVNALVRIEVPAGSSPQAWLEKLQAWEHVAGRRPRAGRNLPRPLDLDLITFGDLERETESLILPHPRAQQRRFVLEPLCEIAPEFVFPGQTRTARELLARLPPRPAVQRVRADAPARKPTEPRRQSVSTPRLRRRFN